MVSGPVCTFLALPGMMLWDFLLQVMSNWVFALTVLIAGIIVFGIITVLTSFEILELIPLLSVVIDWLELLFLSPFGQIIFIYFVISLGVFSGLIPCNGII
jgi:hypothetical protein